MLNTEPGIECANHDDIRMDIVEVQWEYSVGYHAVFRDIKGNIIGLFIFHEYNGTIFINDSTSSSSYRHFSESMKAIYQWYWYSPNDSTIPWMWPVMLLKLLEYIKETYPAARWVNFSSNTNRTNSVRLKKLIEKTRSISSIILDLRWGSNDYVWTIKIKD